MPTAAEIEALFALPFNDLLFQAHTVHRRHFDPNAVQLSTLLSIKTGGCSEDCGYCSQSVRFDTGVGAQPLMALEEVVAAARAAKARGATRFCMGAAWRGPKDKDLEQVAEMVRAVKALGLETCVTLGMLREGQAERLAAAGLDYYNHNLDTSRAHYPRVIRTHTFEDRLDTLAKVRAAGIKVCCGGIMGLGESRADRAAFIAELAALDPPPESVPINLLVRIPGTPLGDQPALDPLEFVRTIAVARIALPTSMVRLSAGRTSLPDHLQALCFFAGANSIFYGDRLLTTPNPEADADRALFEQLGLRALPADGLASTAEAGCPGAVAASS
ncbi:MAG TPA: biotin synthase BioB [Burkholderiales bacterium]